MYIDKYKLFSEGQTLATGVSTNTINRQVTGEAYVPLFLAVTIDAALTAAQGLEVAIEHSDTPTGTYTKLVSFTAKKQSGLVVAQRFPRGAKQYVRLQYTVTGTPTAKVNAFLTPDVPTRIGELAV